MAFPTTGNKKLLKVIYRLLAQLLSSLAIGARLSGRSGDEFPGWSNQRSVANGVPPLRRFFGAA